MNKWSTFEREYQHYHPSKSWEVPKVSQHWQATCSFHKMTTGMDVQIVTETQMHKGKTGNIHVEIIYKMGSLERREGCSYQNAIQRLWKETEGKGNNTLALRSTVTGADKSLCRREWLLVVGRPLFQFMTGLKVLVVKDSDSYSL